MSGPIKPIEGIPEEEWEAFLTAIERKPACLLPDDDTAVGRLLDAVMEVYYPKDSELVTEEIVAYVRANEIPRLIERLREGGQR